MPVFEFVWEEGNAIMEIEADKETVKKLLYEYRNSDPHYNIDDWCNFLNKKGIKATIIEPEFCIYF